jgi:hypothetical protein
MLSCLLSTAKKANSLTMRLVFSVSCDGDRYLFSFVFISNLTVYTVQTSSLFCHRSSHCTSSTSFFPPPGPTPALRLQLCWPHKQTTPKPAAPPSSRSFLPRCLPHLGPPRLRQCRLARLHRPLGCPTFAAYSSLSPLPSEAPPAPARRCLLSSSYPLTRTRALLARPLPRAPHPRAPLGVPGCYE